MNYLLYEGTEYVDTGIKCPRCDYKILRETYKSGEPTSHFSCERIGCTWPNYYSNKIQLIEQDTERVSKKIMGISKVEQKAILNYDTRISRK